MPGPVFGKVKANIIVVDYMRWKYLKKGNEKKQIIDWVNQMGRIVRRILMLPVAHSANAIFASIISSNSNHLRPFLNPVKNIFQPVSNI